METVEILWERDMLVTFWEESQKVLSWLEQETVPGSLAGDLEAVLDLARSEVERIAAAKRTAERIKKPFSRERWEFIKVELYRGAELHRRTPREELSTLVLTRLFEVSDGLDYFPVGERVVQIPEEGMEVLELGPEGEIKHTQWKPEEKNQRGRLTVETEKSLTKYLLGPGWKKRREKEVSIELVGVEKRNPSGPPRATEEELEIKSLLTALAKSLKPQGLELINALWNGLDDEDIAAFLGISRENVRQRRHRLRETVRKALEL